MRLVVVLDRVVSAATGAVTSPQIEWEFFFIQPWWWSSPPLGKVETTWSSTRKVDSGRKAVRRRIHPASGILEEN